jgi:hypothetical protein
MPRSLAYDTMVLMSDGVYTCEWLANAPQDARRGKLLTTIGHDCVSMRCKCSTLSFTKDIASSICSSAGTVMK